MNWIFSERKGKLTKWRLTEDLKLEKVSDKDTGAILDMKFDQGMQFRWKTSTLYVMACTFSVRFDSLNSPKEFKYLYFVDDRGQLTQVIF